jgi:hypothetical protein
MSTTPAIQGYAVKDGLPYRLTLDPIFALDHFLKEVTGSSK